MQVEDLWAMVARALSVTVMILWYDCGYRWITYGPSNDEEGNARQYAGCTLDCASPPLATTAGLLARRRLQLRGCALLHAQEEPPSHDAASRWLAP